AGEALAAGFFDPPDSAKPWAYWWWLDGNASEEGIVRDLEEMRRQGISGFLLFDAGEGKGSPVGPTFLSSPWRELFGFAVREAARLGFEMGVNLCSGWNAGGTWVTPEHAAKKIVWSEVAVEGPGKLELDLPQPPLTRGHYRDVAVLAIPRREREGRPAIQHLEVKSGRKGIWTNTRNSPWEELPETPGEEDCARGEVLDLTERLGPGGRLSWEAPAGRWCVLRFGSTLLGSLTKCASPGSQGLEIDPLSAEAMDVHFRETAEKLIADAGPHARSTLRWLHVDSYEVGADVGGEQPTWTPRFREEFRARRGYDLLPFLPVLAGKIVDGRGVSNRFLRDYRLTIGELIAEKHYGRLAELARSHGLGTHPESGGPFWPHIDALACLGRSDIPMGEFWKRKVEGEDWVWYRADYPLSDTVKQAATAAHIYGKRLSQAEAFTSMGPNWEEAPWDLKDIGDLAFAAGLTRNVLCFYVHQPRLDIVPGWQWEAAGTHFDRNVTWWSRSSAWLRYLARCQHLLAQGHFVADVLYFAGEDVPSFVPGRAFLDPPLPTGRDYDVTNAEVLLTRLGAREGRLVLPDGMSYRLLVLPGRRTMSPRVLGKIAEIVRAGATVLGARPERAPGLEGCPGSDEEVRRLAAELWGDVDGERVRERRFGLGRVIQGRSIEEVLLSDGLPPDFEVSGAPSGAIAWIHRSAPEAEIWFVSNQTDREVRIQCAFRVSGRAPELWDAVTGEVRDAEEFSDDGLRTAVPLVLAPRGSVFVLFRRPAAAREGRGRNFPDLRPYGEIPGPWIVSFDPKLGGPERAVFERLEDWTQRPEEGIRFYSGTATYRAAFDLPQSLRGRTGPVYLDLGKVRNLAEVRLNGRGLGVVWTAPWRVEISAVAREGRNELEIDVVNLWPNRLVGDAGLAPERRVTATNVRKFTRDSPLLPSGLLGPVRLLAPER
ncbi:MAG: glycosyl hydrolase, partial [Planctomycetota bacterium]